MMNGTALIKLVEEWCYSDMAKASSILRVDGFIDYCKIQKGLDFKSAEINFLFKKNIPIISS